MIRSESQKQMHEAQRQECNLAVQLANANASSQQSSQRSTAEPNDETDSCWSDSMTSACDDQSHRVANLATSPEESTKNAVDGKSNQDSPRAKSRVTSSRCNRSRRLATGERLIRKRVMANERERERTKSLNEALEILRNRLPVPEADKRSKIQTLRTAKEYIEYLGRVMRSSSSSSSSNNNNNNRINNTINGNGSHTTSVIHNLDHNHQYEYQHNQHNQHHQMHANYTCYNNNNGNNQVPKQQVDSTNSKLHLLSASNQADSPLTYKFYKFRLKDNSSPRE